jgi:hypothetical protein
MLAVALLPAACRREPKPPIPRAGTAVYQEPSRLFSCEGPVSWKVLEDQGGSQRVTFLGPPDGPAPFSASIGVYYYSKQGSSFATPQEYFESQKLAPGQTGPLVFKPFKGLAVYEFSAKRLARARRGRDTAEPRQEATVLIPAPAGFFAAVYSAPETAFAELEPAFRGLVESLRLGD